MRKFAYEPQIEAVEAVEARAELAEADVVLQAILRPL